MTIEDVTDSLAVLGLMGPRSRELLTGLSTEDLGRRRVRVRRQPRDRSCRRADSGDPHHVRRRARVGAVRARRGRPLHLRRDLAPPGPSSGWSTPGTTRSRPCAWRRGIEPSAASSLRTSTRSRPGCRSPASSRPSVDFVGRSAVESGQGSGPGSTAGLVRARRSRGHGLGWRAAHPRRRAGRPGHVGDVGRPRSGAGVGLAWVHAPPGVVADAAFVRAGRYEIDVGGRRTPVTHQPEAAL